VTKSPETGPNDVPVQLTCTTPPGVGKELGVVISIGTAARSRSDTVKFS